MYIFQKPLVGDPTKKIPVNGMGLNLGTLFSFVISKLIRVSQRKVVNDRTSQFSRVCSTNIMNTVVFIMQIAGS
jgi:hypothetical protein